MKWRGSGEDDASREGEQECWFEGGGCLESSEMDSGSWRDCCQSGVNPATPVYGNKTWSKLDDKLAIQLRSKHKNLNITPQLYLSYIANAATCLIHEDSLPLVLRPWVRVRLGVVKPTPNLPAIVALTEF